MEKKHFSINKKMILFIISIVFFASFSVLIISFTINVNQINNYYKRLTLNSAINCASLIDSEFLKEFKEVIASDEYQTIRQKAEETDDESLVEIYLKEKNLWDKYNEQRNIMINYVQNMADVKYMYLIVWDQTDKTENARDMYLIDADDVELYNIGYFKCREPKFEGIYPSDTVGAIISNGDWGWLCSGYKAIYDDEGKIICHIGCDIGMDEIIKERYQYLLYMTIGTLISITCIFILAFYFIKKSVTKPLKLITNEMKKFSPTDNKDYKAANVLDLNINTNDEISDIYQAIKNMQIKIIDYINDITIVKHENSIAKNVIKDKDKTIGQMSKDAYKDSLTSVGNKTAYIKKVTEINHDIEEGFTKFAIVMMDVNNLKFINDNLGHSVGDEYLKGCCHMICEKFKHSPIYRIGGDEFVALLIGDDFNNRNNLVNELKAAFKQSFEDENLLPQFRYSASIGMAKYNDDDKTIEFVFKRADKYMYEEKMKFKNKGR